MKPREKVVSAQDVQSSLYYCHLASEDDDALLQDDPHENFTSDTEVDELNTSDTKGHQTEGPGQAGDRHFHRSVVLPRSTIAGVDGSKSGNRHQIRRKPVVTQNVQEQPTSPQHQARRILGPRPLISRSGPSVPRIPRNDIEPDSQSQSITVERAFNFVPVPQEDIGLSAPSEGPYNHSHSVMPSDRYITLIRRDPSTENQWNIGSLSLSGPKSLQSRNQNTPMRKKDISINLSTIGYTKFTNQCDDTNASVFQRELTVYAVSDTKNGLQSGSAPASTGQASHSFLTPWRTPCTFQTAATGRALKCYHSLLESFTRSSTTSKSGNGSQTTLVSELRFNLPTLFEKSTAKKKENRRPTSFQPHGNNRHGLMGGVRSVSPEKSADGQGIATGRSLLSEQSSPTFDAPFHHRARSAELTSSYNSRLEDAGEEFEDEVDTQLDLLLGQERAGGGFNGNKAKLGKLIVYGGQGLAMLDLLVAANMAIWFRDILE